MNAIVMIVCAVTMQPSLTLLVSDNEIAQCDHVAIKCVLRNSTDASVTINSTGSLSGKSIRIEIKAGEQWREVGLVSEQFAIAGTMPAPDPILEADTSYVEYDVIMFNWMSFVFEKTGKYIIRATVSCSDKQVSSKPVLITVNKRESHALGRIKESFRGVPVKFTPGMTPDEKKQRIIASMGREKFGKLGSLWFEGEVSQGLKDLADVGGNLGAGIERLELLARILDEKEPVGDDVLGFISKRMNKVDAEIAFHVLGRHYQKNQDWTNLSKVVKALPDKSIQAYQWEDELAIRLRRVPRVVVPNDSERP